jgi:hypothetical protein
VKVFIDESECRRSGFYYIGGLLCDERAELAVQECLDRIASSISAEIGQCPEEIEFHGYEVCHGEGGWAPLSGNIQRRIEIWMELARCVASAEAKFFVKAVRHGCLVVRGNHELTLLYLLEAVQRKQGLAVGKGAVTIHCDEINIQEEIRREFYAAQKFGTGGWRSSRLELFAGSIEFHNSRDFRAIQAVDMLLYAYRRKLYYEHLIINGRNLSHGKKMELKALKRIYNIFKSQASVLPNYEPRPLL